MSHLKLLDEIPETDECLIWPRYLMPKGYGQVAVGRRMLLTHRVVCERTHGPCPPGHETAHSCGQRACYNPRHLRWATSSENQLDKRNHGTDNRGERHPLARLTQEQVDEIRQRRDEKHYVLAAEYGVGRVQITRILNGTRWA